MTRYPLITHRNVIGLMLGTAFMVWGCTSEPVPDGPPAPKPSSTTKVTGTSTGSGIGGTVGGATSSASASPSATATLAPTPTPSPTPTVEPSYVPFAIGVTVTIATPSINLAPVSGPGLYPYQTTVTADVTLSNGLHTSLVDWSTSNVAIATVSVGGQVTAGSTIGGLVKVIGTSKDKKASASVNLNVTTLGGAQIIVD